MPIRAWEMGMQAGCEDSTAAGLERARERRSRAECWPGGRLAGRAQCRVPLVRGINRRPERDEPEAESFGSGYGSGLYRSPVSGLVSLQPQVYLSLQPQVYLAHRQVFLSPLSGLSLQFQVYPTHEKTVLSGSALATPQQMPILILLCAPLWAL